MVDNFSVHIKKKLLVFIAVGFCCILVTFYVYSTYFEYYQTGENDVFAVSTGETFKIKVYENGSTGYSNCWLNENQKGFIKLVKKEYQPGFLSGYYKGRGGIVTLTFEGLKAGIDTIKIADCFVANGNGCLDFNERNTLAEHVFIIDISE